MNDAFLLVKMEPDLLYTGTYEDYRNDIESLATVKCREHPEFVSMEHYHDSSMQDSSARDVNPLDQMIEQLGFEQKAKALAVLKKTWFIPERRGTVYC